MEHFYEKINVEGWFTFPHLYHMVVNESPEIAHFVEVGAWKGASAAFMAVEIVNSGKHIRFDCVDTWKGSVEHHYDIDVKNDTLYETFLRNMEPVQGYYNPIRMTSVDASKLYLDKSLDFVYIDASHDYQSVKQDILSWYPKIKSGGKLAGHDFDIPSVKKAVFDILNSEYTIMCDEKNWFIIKK